MQRLAANTSPAMLPTVGFGERRRHKPKIRTAWRQRTEKTPTERNEVGESNRVVWGRPRILLEAVSKGRLRQLRLLLDAGINVNCKDEDTGETALIRAMFLEDARFRKGVAKMLINYGAKVKVADKRGRTALSWACLLGREDMLKLFLSNPELHLAMGSIDSEGNTNLILACMSGNANVVETMARSFRRNRLDANRTNGRGMSALSLCYKRDFLICAEILLNEGHVTPCGNRKLLRDCTSPGVGRGRRRNRPNTSLRENSCNLPKLFRLYTEQLTHSYPRKCRSSGGIQCSAY